MQLLSLIFIFYCSVVFVKLRLKNFVYDYFVSLLMSLKKNLIKFLTFSNIGETDLHKYLIMRDEYDINNVSKINVQ